jgi:predicted dehydrogenase
MEYPNGATGVFITTTSDAPGTNRFEITTEMGKIICEDEKLTLYKLDENERTFSKNAKGGFDSPHCTISQVETDGENPQHVGVINAFAGHILHGTPLVANGEEGINGLTLSNAMHLSSWLKKPVDIPIDEELFLSELNRRRATSRLKTSESVHFDTSGSFGSK